MRALITDYVKNYQEKKQTRTDWREPIVGVAAAVDPLFPQLKQIIGPNHALPGELVPEYPIGSGDACGKCMCGVPCSLGIPGKAKKSKSDS